MPGEIRCAKAGLHGLPYADCRLRCLVKMHVRQLKVADDDRKQIVEVVGHAPGHNAEAFQLLRMEKLTLKIQALFLKSLLVGNIMSDTEVESLPAGITRSEE